jgi:hypothetical protein
MEHVSSDPSRVDTQFVASKKPYETPVLRPLGDVVTLTKGGGGSRVDGGGKAGSLCNGHRC